MQRQLVNSSDLRAVGYDSIRRVLEVEFKAGRIYQYQGVSVEVYNELMNAYSKGRFFNDHIKDIYSFIKIF